MVHRGLCRELFTLRERTEKRKYSWRYETSIFFWKKLRIEVLSDGSCGGLIILFSNRISCGKIVFRDLYIVQNSKIKNNEYASLEYS